ncbi:MAG: hypothetical protein JWP36_2090 [Paucimonas sp.]|nr:hypothetical protein [Paucimonas sp.]
METTAKRIHPLVAAASVSVILVSLVGVAAMSGLLPNSHSSAAPAAAAAPVASLSAPAVTTPEPSTVAAQSASRAAAAAVDSKYAMATDEAPVKAAPKQVARPKPVTHAQTSTPVHTSPVASTQPAMTTPAPVYAPPPPPVAQAPACYDCGRVESVRAVQAAQSPSGVGVVGGAVLGGILGNQVGNGNGRTLATVAGAIAGGYGGNEVEKRTRQATSYQVRVRMEDGQVRTFPYNSQPQWSVGDQVRVVDGYLRSANRS